MFRSRINALRGFFLPLLILTLGVSEGAKASEIWFAPGDDLDVKGVVAHPDFQHLFDSDSQWPTGVAHISVMELRNPWFLRMPTEAGLRVTSFLKQHRIALAVPMGGVPSDTCGQNIEGIMSTRGIDAYPRLMKKRGIQIDYAVLDEPLFYGHDFIRSDACEFSVAEVAQRVAQSIKIVRRYYPNIKFVLIEPVQSLPGGPPELNEFLNDYRSAAGELPITVRIDVQWNKDWMRTLPPFINMLNARGMSYSVIYDANRGGAAKTDAEWVQSARADVVAFEGTIRQKPQEVLIQTWNPRPEKILPESDPSTMSGFLDWYISHGKYN